MVSPCHATRTTEKLVWHIDTLDRIGALLARKKEKRKMDIKWSTKNVFHFLML
jgi:hypothetical protein